MSKKKLGVLTSALLLCPYILSAATYQWQGTGTSLGGCDLLSSSNWNCGCNPGALDTEQFNSTYPNVCLTPAASDGYSIYSYDFVNSADAFTFNIDIDSNPLTFNGPESITGANKNPTINLKSIDNSNNPGRQLVFANNTTNSTGKGILSIVNSATLNSGSSQNLSYINGFQLLSDTGSLDVPAGATITISNIGTNNSSGDNNSVAYVSDYQWYSNDLSIGDNSTITISNTGYDYTQGGDGGNYVGYAAGNFRTQNTVIGDSVTINLSNYGVIDQGSSTPGGFEERIAIMSDPQASFDGTLKTGDNFTLIAANYGKDEGNSGGNNVGTISSDYFIYFQDNVTLGNNATISHTNEGIANSTFTKDGGEIGVAYAQIYSNGSTTIKAGDYFTLTAINIGHDSSHGKGGIEVGSLDDDYQVKLNSDLILGDHATITVANSGTSTGTATDNRNDVGYAEGQLSLKTIDAGKSLKITITNEGLNTSNNPASEVGYIHNNQFVMNEPFAALDDFNLTVTNNASGTGNQTGVIDRSQIRFRDTCTINDGTYITAANYGTGRVDNWQMQFEQGFDLTGKATFHAINSTTGTIGGGISLEAGMGGNVNIILENSQLSITSTETDFTIGALNGTGTARTVPHLTINTDPGVFANFSGEIEQFGMSPTLITKKGLGTQVLSGINTYEGPTYVEEGRLIINGSVLSDTIVSSPGILGGTGTVYGHVTNTGTISPGESIGTIHFANGFDNLGGNYDVEVTGAPTSDLIEVTGIANIEGGIVYVSSADGTYAFRHRYTIVDASDEVVGDYDRAISLNPLIVPTLSDDLQHVYLYLTTDISAAANTCNQQLVATELDGITSTDPVLQRLLSLVADLPLNQAANALDELVGYQHGSDLFTTVAINRQFIRRLYDPIRFLVTNEPSCYCPCTNFMTAWLEGGGVFTGVRGQDRAHGFHTTGYEVTGGVQATLSCDWTVGLAASYEHDELHFKRSAGHGNHNTWFAGLYGLYRPSCFYALADLAYGHSSNTLDRHFSIGSQEFRAHSKPVVNEYTFYGEGGYDFSVCDVLVQPFVGIEAGTFQRNHVRESYADGAELDLKSRGISLAVSRLGFHFTTHNYGIDLSFDVAWNYRFSETSNTLTERFVEFGKEFTLCNGHDLDRNSVDYALTLSSCIDCNWNLYLEGLGESWSHSHVYAIQAGVQYSW